LPGRAPGIHVAVAPRLGPERVGGLVEPGHGGILRLRRAATWPNSISRRAAPS